MQSKNKIIKLSFIVILALLFSSFTHNNVYADDLGLVGYWAFDDGRGNITKDLSVYSNNGILINSPSWTIGKYGNALDFNSSANQYVSVTNSYVLNQSNSFSICSWGKSTSQGSLLYKGDTTVSGTNYALYFAPVAEFFVSTNTTHYSPGGSVSLIDGKYHFICGIYNNKINKVYVYWDYLDGGSNVNSLNTSGNIQMSNSNLTIGKASLGITNWNMSIDEVRLYNRALLPSEVSAMFLYGYPIATITTTTPSIIVLPNNTNNTGIMYMGALLGIIAIALAATVIYSKNRN